MTFGKQNDASLKRYEQYIRTRNFGYDAAKKFIEDEAFFARLKQEHDLEVINLKKLFVGVTQDMVGSHKEMPY